jgi:hypothetical protein
VHKWFTRYASNQVVPIIPWRAEKKSILTEGNIKLAAKEEPSLM